MTSKLRVIVPAVVLLALVLLWWTLPPNQPPAPTGAPGVSAGPPRVTIAPHPPATAPASPIEDQIAESSLLLPLEVRLADIKPFVETAVPKKFDQKLDLGAYGPAKDVRAVLDLVRGDVTLTPQGDRLAFSFPLTGKIPVSARIETGIGNGLFPRETIDNVRGVVSGWVKVGIDGQWNVTHESDAGMRVDKAEVRFPLGINIGVRERLEEQSKAALAKLLRETLASNVAKLALRAHADKVWSKLHATRLVRESPRVTVSLQPVGVRLRPLRFDDDGVARAAVGISLRTATRVEADAPQAERTTLPDLAMGASPGGTFHVVLPSSVPASALAESFRSSLQKKPLASPGGVTFAVQDVHVSLANGHAHLAIDFEATRHAPRASAGGTVYLAGKLAYDPQARVLRLTEARYDPNTQAALAGGAEWLAEPAIVQGIAGAIAFPLDEELKKGDAAVREQVRGLEAPAHVDLRLTVTNVSLHEARASGEWLHLFFDVKGDSHAALRFTARP